MTRTNLTPDLSPQAERGAGARQSMAGKDTPLPADTISLEVFKNLFSSAAVGARSGEVQNGFPGKFAVEQLLADPADF